jgi:ligand-binding sensor domain-containing protein
MPRFGLRFLPVCVRPAAACVIVFFALALHGAEPSPEFHTRTWRTEEGLPHNSVGCMLQDRTGFMWFGTSGGLARFDGREFKEFRLPAPYSARGYNIRELAEDHTGALLVLPASGEVLRLVDGEFTVHPVSRLLTGGASAPADLFVEPGGAVWVGSHNGALVRWQPDGSSQAFENGGSVATRTKKFSFALNKEGETWVAADGFLAVFRGGQLHAHPSPPAGPLLLAQGANGLIWVCATEQLWRLD